MTKRALWSELRDAFLHLLLPQRPLCALCKLDTLTGEEAVCPLCARQVRRGRPPFCHQCGREDVAGRCSDCVRRPVRQVVRAVSYGPYQGRLRDLIWVLKSNGRQEVLPLLQHLLVVAYREQLLDCGIEALVPVPIRATTRRERGFNQAELLARGLGRQVRLPVCDALAWAEDGPMQKSRRRAERLHLPASGVRLRAAARAVHGRRVLLIDDVYTTGATAERCAQALREAGVQAVYVLTVGR